MTMMRRRSYPSFVLVGGMTWSLLPVCSHASAAFWSLVNPWKDDVTDAKVVTFVRHGCTYMNEYLGGADGGKRFGSPSFTDVFTTAEKRLKYHDTLLSPRGEAQVLQELRNRRPQFVSECDLVVVSPLTRALQTYDLGLRSHVDEYGLTTANEDGVTNGRRPIPVLAHPDAAERLYLVSDLGRPVNELRSSFPLVDFETCFRDRNNEVWWYDPQQHETRPVEWRPTGNGQTYGCSSEPKEVFNTRMSRFWAWLRDRPENHIVVVCHHGVIDWMLGVSFENCQYRTVRFNSIKAPSTTPLFSFQ